MRLSEFSENLRQDVLTAAADEEGTSFAEDVFTSIFADYLVDAGEIEGPEICFHRSYGMKANGYSFSEDLGRLHLFVSEYTASIPPQTVGKAEVEQAYRRAVAFIERAFQELHLQIEESSPAFDMALAIRELRDRILDIRVYLLTDGITSVDSLNDTDIQGLPVRLSIWDLQRVYRLHSSGLAQEVITIDFAEHYGGAIPCIVANNKSDEYKTILAVVPGELLASIYYEFGARLLEQNVRSFLQARGKVNKGIRNTINTEPERFLAFNNGITATAEEVELAPLGSVGFGIASVRNLQIVNGGQTTASLFQAKIKDKASLAGVNVQAKINIIPAELMSEMVPLISRYANSQNKVNEADFSANDPFHRELESLSRRIWAPSADGTKNQTKWFYERARGQFTDAVNRERTPARQRQFKMLHPTSQKFTKTDVAKFVGSWEMKPHIVSLGAQKNFVEFTLAQTEGNPIVPDQTYFERLIALAILFRTTERVVTRQKFGGYRANIVTYSIALLSRNTRQRIDLNAIWRTQTLDEVLQDEIARISHIVWPAIIHPPGSGNVTEWCKKKACWDRVALLSYIPSKSLKLAETPTPSADVGPANASSKGAELISAASAISATTWYECARWAQETKRLAAWQRGLAFTLARTKENGREPTLRQAKHGLDLLQDAIGFGFTPPSL